MPLTDSPAPTSRTESLVTLLLRGLLAGLVAGVLAGGVAFVLGEPHIDAAIAIEESAGAHEHDAVESGGHSHDEDEALVSRTGQRFGLFLATGLAGMALGAVFSVAYYYLRLRRVSASSAPAFGLVLAGLAWLAVEAVPFFKYPANPPAVGDPETITQRTWLWFASVVLGLIAVSVAAVLARAVRDRQFLSVRVAAPVAAFLAVVTVGYLILPKIDEVADDFPASLLWEFRLSSLAVQAMLWLVLGVAFAFLTERAARNDAERAARITR